ncbi:unnamed protein product [Urochloa decumbens]|uniref:Uncharacterized protein n=1 Tax=Urochloa decumbens TaxID=240449 RepID=A0ABC8XCS8_9POAL
MGAPTGGEIPDHRWRVVDSAGWAFLIGAPCGGAFHFCHALISNWPRRLATGARAAVAHAPRVAGSLAAYSAVRCAFERAASVVRGREDPWNSVAAASAAWALLDARLGPRAAARSAVLGAACGAFVEGAFIVYVRVFVEEPPPPPLPPVPQRDDPGHTPTPGPGRFLGIPRQEIVVQEIAVDDLPSHQRKRLLIIS